jgi:hypothetical protein
LEGAKPTIPRIAKAGHKRDSHEHAQEGAKEVQLKLQAGRGEIDSYCNVKTG